MSRRRDERGSALVEFALVVPVFLMIVVAAASLVWLMGARSAVTGAARDAARFASIRHTSEACSTPCYPTPSEVLAYAKERAGGYGVDGVELVVNGVAATTDVSPVQYRNQLLEVKVTRTLPNAFSSFAGLFGIDDLDYTSTARVRAE